MKFDDSQKYALNSILDSILWTMVSEISGEDIQTRVSTAKNIFADIEIVGKLVEKSYQLTTITDNAYSLDALKASSVFYPNQQPNTTLFFKAALDLRDFCALREKLLKEQNINDLGSLPPREEVLNYFEDKLKSISMSLIDSKNKTDFKSKITYAQGILNKSYLPDIDIIEKSK